MNASKFIALFFFLLPCFIQAQHTHMIRIADENDCLNLLERKTDEGYTNGTSIDFFLIKNSNSTFFLDRWMPKAGDSCINTFGWSAMQMMAAPRRLSLPVPEVNDYPYSATLFVTHSLHSSNPAKKYNIQSAIAAGVIGSQALGEQSQKFIHNVWRLRIPKGWDYQTKTDILLNASVGAEKLIAVVKGLDITGGAKLSAGTMLDRASVYTVIRFGQMNAYFDGLINQFATAKSSAPKTQFYFILKPSLEYTAYDALYEGGVFNGLNDYYIAAKERGDKTYERKKTIGKVDFGFVFSSGKFSISYLQKHISPAYEGKRKHAVGNITLGLAW